MKELLERDFLLGKQRHENAILRMLLRTPPLSGIQRGAVPPVGDLWNFLKCGGGTVVVAVVTAEVCEAISAILSGAFRSWNFFWDSA